MIKQVIKDRIILWAIKQITKDTSGSYGDMRYCEDVLTNEFGEKMFIFSHKIVPIDKKKLAEANAKLTSNEVAFTDTSTTQQGEQNG